MPVQSKRKPYHFMLAMAGVAALVVGGIGLAHAESGSGDFVSVPSHRNFSATVAALKSAASSNHMMVMGKIDQARVLSMTGLHLAGGESFLVGNPVIGKKAFSMDPAAGIVLPARMYVWSDHGKTYVGYLKPSYVLGAINPKFDMMSNKLDMAFKKIADQAAK